LNVINVSLFTPALLFSKVRATARYMGHELTAGGLLADARQAQGDVDHSSWVCSSGHYLNRSTLTSSFVVVSGLSALVAWVMAKIFKLKKSQT
jgi:predicted permease